MSDLNDPRVFFAAERTLLAWNRTSLTLMAFGFVIERFGLFLHVLLPKQDISMPFWIGVGFIVLGALAVLIASLQYRKMLFTLKPIEIPKGYWAGFGIFVSLIVAALGIALAVYLFIDAKL